MPPILDPHYTKPSQLLKKQYGTDRRELGGSPLNVIVAAGPYTVDADLEFEPLEVLLEQVGKEKPDVIVLVRSFFSSPSFHVVLTKITSCADRTFCRLFPSPHLILPLRLDSRSNISNPNRVETR